MSGASGPELPLLRLALTGTPGTGKTRLSEELQGLVEIQNQSILAETKGFLGQDDGGSKEIDVEGLSTILVEEWSSPPEKTQLIDGHLSHLLPVDAIIILRAHPLVIDARLHLRDYEEQKILDNVEWEMIGGPWLELEEIDIPILELDSGVLDPNELTTEVLNWLSQDCAPERPAEILDWLDDMASKDW
jgi:adenylate kinase